MGAHMRMLTISEAAKLLAPHGLTIGSWNEVTEITPTKQSWSQCVPPANSRELFAFSNRLVRWLTPQKPNWIFLQVDNSTSPLNGEEEVFESLVFSGRRKWDVGLHRSFLFEANDETDEVMLTPGLCMFIFFALLFEWHVHLVCETEAGAQCLGLVDGVAYLFGSAELVGKFQQS